MNENNENNFKINNLSDFVDLKKWASLDGFDYTPPMQLFFEEFRADMDLKIENNAVEVCQRYGFEVDKEELKKALAYDRHQYEKGYHDARMAFETPVGEWVPVSDRLPEDRETVFVTAYWHETYQVMEASYFGNGEWWCVPFNNCGDHMQRLKPIAWMPLPEPYKDPLDHSDEPIRCKAENCSPEGCKHCAGYKPIDFGGDT